MPQHAPLQHPSGKGSEFLTKELSSWLAHLRVNHTTTQGYGPAANGGGETSVGYMKRHDRHLMAGARLDTSWWGASVLVVAVEKD